MIMASRMICCREDKTYHLPPHLRKYGALHPWSPSSEMRSTETEHYLNDMS